MTPAEIKTQIKRNVKEPIVLTLYDDAIDEIILNGVTIFGFGIKEVAPSFFNKRISVSSNTHVFAWPSDCASILNVQDLKTNAKIITDATNATPVVITSVSHGFSDDDIIVIHDIVGNTAANGTWKVANKTDDTLELYGSTGNADYVSDGKMFKEATNFAWITKKESSEISLNNKSVWYPRERNIVIGKYDFKNDILIEYLSNPASSDDIPAEYHIGLVAYGVIFLSQILPEKSFHPNIIAYHTDTLSLILKQIKTGTTASINPEPVYFMPGED